MENQKDPRLNPEDDLKAENNLLKLKLGLEHGMQMEDTSTLSPGLENQWLKSVYAFEQQFKDAKPIKVYDYIGQPAFRKWDTLTSGETGKELERIQSVMEKSGVEVGCICEYDDAIIYRFITEELFQHEMDGMFVPGMTCHFIYEEFHPNHDYDLRRQANDFMNAIFTRPWNAELDDMALARKVSFSDKDYDRTGISAIIRAFQEAYAAFDFEKFDICEVLIDTELTKADVCANLSWSGKMKQGDKIRHEGNCSFHFVREDDYWSIGDLYIPGLTGKKE